MPAPELPSRRGSQVRLWEERGDDPRAVAQSALTTTLWGAFFWTFSVPLNRRNCCRRGDALSFGAAGRKSARHPSSRKTIFHICCSTTKERACSLQRKTRHMWPSRKSAARLAGESGGGRRDGCLQCADCSFFLRAARADGLMTLEDHCLATQVRLSGPLQRDLGGHTQTPARSRQRRRWATFRGILDLGANKGVRIRPAI